MVQTTQHHRCVLKCNDCILRMNVTNNKALAGSQFGYGMVVVALSAPHHTLHFPHLQKTTSRQAVPVAKIEKVVVTTKTGSSLIFRICGAAR